ITAVGTEADVTVPNGAMAIDVEERTILPGLIDGQNSDLLRRLQFRDGQHNSIPVETYLTTQIEKGVTTVRVMGWTWEEMQETHELKKSLEEFGNTIPAVVLSGVFTGTQRRTGYQVLPRSDRRCRHGGRSAPKD
ncbi:MAG TPA: hypothetical protein VLA72_12120, partial [Anaerolineales bacterium]|nr:hypothetical protein [Anaerolineales bacterium]